MVAATTPKISAARRSRRVCRSSSLRGPGAGSMPYASDSAEPRRATGSGCCDRDGTAILELMPPSSDPTRGLPHTDPDALTRLERFGGRKLLLEMIALFRKSAPERLAAASAGVTANDASAIEHALHALKSSAAQLGAVRLSRLCEQGETIARAGAPAALGELLDACRSELAAVDGWLDRVGAGSPP